SACAGAGHWRQALHLKKELVSQGHLIADTITYSAVISACGNGGKWQLVLLFVREMDLARIVPDEMVNNMALSACERGHQWFSALSILRSLRMRAAGGEWF
ncbi:unnamed protein product, partial [Polarella glacialis]